MYSDGSAGRVDWRCVRREGRERRWYVRTVRMAWGYQYVCEADF